MYGIVAGFLTLERFLPADRKQAVFSRGLFQDLFYFLINTPLVLFVLSFQLAAFDRIFSAHAEFLVIEGAASWPFWLLVIVSFLMGDLLAWFHHWVRHKIPFFWRFHALHHSQTQLNVFTDARNHPVDVFIAQGIRFVPFFCLGAQLQDRVLEVASIALLLTWFPRFYHANVGSNLGPLRFVFVTPQSHRIHHSPEIQHRDRNFGVILSVWDRLFGTHCDDVASYPPTGVPDPAIPLETRSGHGILRTYASQLAYPFRSVSG